MLAVSCDSRAAVDAMNEAAAKHAARPTSMPSRIMASCTIAAWPTLTGDAKQG
jgi:hypothetical protein